MVLSTLQSSIDALQRSLDTDTIPWKSLVLYLLWSVYLFEAYLSLRQYRLYSLTTPPSTLAPHVDLDTFQKSQRYGRDKARFGFFAAGFNHLLNVAIVQYNLYARAWSHAATLVGLVGLPDREIPRSIAWMVVMFVLRELPAIPLTLYRNFVIEQRHGFNKMTLATFATDTLKEWMLGFCIGAPLMGGLLWIIRWSGDRFVTYVVAFLLAFQLVAMLLYPTLIQPLFNKLTPLPDGMLRDRVVALATALRFPLKHLYQIDGSKRSSHSNAYFFGVVPGGNKHIVIFDTLIEKSSADEIEAVLAHELGHWAHSDPTKLLLLSQAQIVLTMSLFTLFIHNAALFRAFGFVVPASASAVPLPLSKLVDPSGQVDALTYLPVVIGLELFQLILNPSDALLKFALNSAIRRMEYAADAFAARLERPGPTAAERRAAETYAQRQATGAEGEKQPAPDPTAKEPYTALLGRALVKLHINNLSSMHHDPLFSAYHYSHPTLSERLAALDQIERKSS